ncbi:hypothetical protein BDQ94DRAFT_110088 [Aspergillus welwitschiae]|uniref:Uncharacterized protein n=1 Tax=Aspergillus welwitschiae TaxID=1341132 RepID=A0A3F3PLH4_9EURO|nr:hypothetical protein BDQ94DRAFT_110088 [Aspergillus welwitschiae]RDH27698.1 hypothetical protein BDQ94DRAFT_110088 [Aspergillus welwitschiae]
MIKQHSSRREYHGTEPSLAWLILGLTLSGLKLVDGLSGPVSMDLNPLGNISEEYIAAKTMISWPSYYALGQLVLLLAPRPEPEP